MHLRGAIALPIPLPEDLVYAPSSAEYNPTIPRKKSILCNLHTLPLKQNFDENRFNFVPLNREAFQHWRVVVIDACVIK